MRNFAYPAVLLLFLAACGASQWGDSGISLCDSRMTQLGPDTYMSSGLYGNGCGAEYKIRHAGVFCQRMGKQVIVNNIDNSKEGNVIFQCLSSGDPALRRPKYQKAPDIVIEQR